MSSREVHVFEIRELLWLWLRGEGLAHDRANVLGGIESPSADISRRLVPAELTEIGAKHRSPTS